MCKIKLWWKIVRASYLGLTLAALMFFYAVASTPAAAQPANQRKLVFDALMSAVDKSRERVQRAIQEAEMLNITLPENITTLHAEALDVVEEALNLSNTGLYEEACKKAIEAMQKLKEVLQIVEGLPIQRGREAEELNATGEAIGLREAIDRAYNFSATIGVLADRSAEQGYNVSLIQGAIDEASSYLTNASALLDQGLVSEAAKKLAEARKMLDLAIAELHGLTRAIKTKQVEELVEKLEKRVEAMQERVARVVEKVPAPVGEVVNKSLMHILSKMPALKKTLQVKELEELQRKFERLKENVEGLEGRGKAFHE